MILTTVAAPPPAAPRLTAVAAGGTLDAATSRVTRERDDRGDRSDRAAHAGPCSVDDLAHRALADTHFECGVAPVAAFDRGQHKRAALAFWQRRYRRLRRCRAQAQLGETDDDPATNF